jgi:PAS domain S-box-containing protein
VTSTRESTRTPAPAALLAVAVVLFAVILTLKLTVRTPGFGFPLLYDIPVALLAIAYGVRGGLTAAAVGMVLYAIGDAVGEVQSNVWGYTSRALTFVLLGGLLGLYSDRLRRADARTRESEAHFRAALEDSPIVVWRQDRELRYTWIHNPALGFTADEVLGLTDSDLIPRDTADRVTEIKREVLESGRGQRVEIEYPNGGEPTHFDLAVNPLRDTAGELAGITGAATDITKLKRTQSELRKSQLGLNRSQQMAKLGSWEWDIASDEVTWSDELHRLYGTSPAEFEASYEAFLERVHPDDREAVEQAIRQALADGGSVEFEHRIVRPDGAVRVMLAYAEVTLDETGTAIAMTGTGRDVTEGRAAEDANRRLAAIVDQSEDAIVAKDTEGIITEWNHGAERLYGYPAGEAIGKSISMLMPRELRGEDWTVLSRILSGQALERHETVRLRKDGRRVEVWLTVSPIREPDGTIVGASSIARDIGELKRTQKELERSNAEFQQFAHVASHDLQEPLRTITGFVQLLEKRYKGQLDAEADTFMGFIVTGVERMQALIDDLLNYSRAGRGDLQTQEVDTSEIARSTLASLDASVREARADIELGALPTLMTDPRALVHVFQNLLSNAIKFSDGQPPRIQVSAEHEQDAWRFSVADNGIGIAPGQAERVFGMFQQLHGRGEYGGTGIGLAICKRLVERLGGRIWCEPRPEGGTVFRFTVPDLAETS